MKKRNAFTFYMLAGLLLSLSVQGAVDEAGTGVSHRYVAVCGMSYSPVLFVGFEYGRSCVNVDGLLFYGALRAQRPIKLIGKANAAGTEVTVDSAEARGVRPAFFTGSGVNALPRHLTEPFDRLGAYGMVSSLTEHTDDMYMYTGFGGPGKRGTMEGRRFGEGRRNGRQCRFGRRLPVFRYNDRSPDGDGPTGGTDGNGTHHYYFSTSFFQIHYPFRPFPHSCKAPFFVRGEKGKGVVDTLFIVSTTAHTHALKIWRELGNSTDHNNWLAQGTAPAEVLTERTTATNPGFKRAASQGRTLSTVSLCSNVVKGCFHPPDSFFITSVGSSVISSI